jgi:hypothetical protein
MNQILGHQQLSTAAKRPLNLTCFLPSFNAGETTRGIELCRGIAGAWQLNWATIPWVSLLVIWTLTGLVLAATLAYGDRIDY